MEQQATLFTNWTEEEFTWNWNGQPWTFKAGENKWMDSHLAKHFAKHLTNREIINADKSINSPEWNEYNKKCFGETIKAESPEKLESEVLTKKNEASAEQAAPKKEEVKVEAPKVEETKKVNDEESFEGLKE